MALEQYRLLQSMRQLKEFTVPQLAREAGVSVNTAYSFVRRSPHLVEEVGKSESKGPGKPAALYVPRGPHVDEMTRALHDLTLAQGETGEAAIEVPAPLLAAEVALVRTPPDGADRSRVLERARSTLASARRFADGLEGVAPEDRTLLDDRLATVGFLCALHEAEDAQAKGEGYPALGELLESLPATAQTRFVRRILSSPLVKSAGERGDKTQPKSASAKREKRGDKRHGTGARKTAALVARHHERRAELKARVMIEFVDDSKRTRRVKLSPGADAARLPDASKCVPLEVIEKSYAEAVLLAARGDLNRAARILNIGPKRLKVLTQDDNETFA